MQCYQIIFNFITFNLKINSLINSFIVKIVNKDF